MGCTPSSYGYEVSTQQNASGVKLVAQRVAIQPQVIPVQQNIQIHPLQLQNVQQIPMIQQLSYAPNPSDVRIASQPMLTNQAVQPKLEKTYEEPTITKEMVEEFQALNVAITQLENNRVRSRLETLKKQQFEIEKEIAALNTMYQSLDAKTKKEFDDYKRIKAIEENESISKFFASQHDFEQKFSKEEEEYIQAKSEQENCYEQLVKSQEQNSKLSEELRKTTTEMNELISLYQKQDSILEKVFGGTYGSLLEDKLEGELDQLQSKFQNVRATLDRWNYCKASVAAAAGQLESGCNRWFALQRIPLKGNSYMVRMRVATEARNQFLAASRNLVSAQRVLHPVKLPYCDASEVETLNKAIAYVYIDALGNGRIQHALNVYQTMHARSVVLAKWVKNVIDQRITVDLAQIREKYVDCRQSLRKERINLMKKKAEAELGETISISDATLTDASTEVEETENVVDVAEADKVEGAENLDEQIEQAKNENVEEGDETDVVVAVMETTKVDEAKKTPLDELAPAPSRNELFGDLDSIMATYDQQKNNLQNEQELAKARQEAHVKEKLQRRRSRKMRLEAQEALQADAQT